MHGLRILSHFRAAPGSISSCTAPNEVNHRQDHEENTIEDCNHPPLGFHVLCHSSFAGITIIALDSLVVFVELAIFIGTYRVEAQVVERGIHSRVTTLRRWSTATSFNGAQFGRFVLLEILVFSGKVIAIIRFDKTTLQVLPVVRIVKLFQKPGTIILKLILLIPETLYIMTRAIICYYKR